MTTTYREADEAQLIGDALVDRHHPHLEDAEIRWLFTSGSKSKAQVCGALQRYAFSGTACDVEQGPDFLIQIAEGDWKGLGRAAREQLVDELLCECGQESSQTDGEPKWVINSPLKVFLPALARHGLQTTEYRRLGQVIRDLPEQLKLGLGDDGQDVEDGAEIASREALDPAAVSRIQNAVEREAETVGAGR